MPNHILKSFAAAMAIALLIISQGCEEPEEIGKDLLPPQDNLNIKRVDSTSIHAFSYLDDSLKTSDPQVLLAGSYFDKIFGQTSAAFFTQLKMSTTNLDFGSNPVVDSVVLSLPYFSFYGDTTAEITLEVRELSQDLFPDTAYYSNQTTNTYKTIIGQRSFQPRPQTPVVLGSDTLAPMLRIPVDHALAERFFNAGASVFMDNASFVNYFRGIQVKAKTNHGDGSILYFDPYSSNANLTIHYHNDLADSLSASFYMGELNAKYSQYHHDYSAGKRPLANELQQQIIQKDTMAPIESVFLQSMAGLNMQVKFPYLSNWRDKNIALNKATLVVKAHSDDLTANTYKEPLRLGLVKKNQEGSLELITDYVNSSEIFDGYFDSNKKEYKFVITQHVQEILNGATDYGLVIVSDNRSRNAYRVALRGPQAAVDAMKLELLYTELE